MTNNKLLQCTLLIAVLIWQTSCQSITDSAPVEDSLGPDLEVMFINGTENTNLKVNRTQESFFTLALSNMGSNNIIEEGSGEGWCIDWKKPIDSNGGVYNNIRLYSTFNVEKWNPLNFLLNIKGQLIVNDPEITYREIQLAVWSLRGFPKFDLNEVSDQDLPSRMMENGQPAYNREKVEEILQIVENGYRDFDFIQGTKFAVIAETPSDVQTVITVVE
jgi:hypothetical protein